MARLLARVEGAPGGAELASLACHACVTSGGRAARLFARSQADALHWPGPRNIAHRLACVLSAAKEPVIRRSSGPERWVADGRGQGRRRGLASRDVCVGQPRVDRKCLVVWPGAAVELARQSWASVAELVHKNRQRIAALVVLERPVCTAETTLLTAARIVHELRFRLVVARLTVIDEEFGPLHSRHVDRAVGVARRVAHGRLRGADLPAG